MIISRYSDRSVRSLKTVLPLVVLFATACDDPFAAQFWDATPDTIQLYSASRPEYVGRGSVLDIAGDPVQSLPVETPGATGNWDFALVDLNGGLALVPAASFAGVSSSRARIGALDNENFDELDAAPSDTTRYTAGPLALRLNAVYVMRSRAASCGFSSGVRYAKMKPVEIDAARGIFKFAVVRNPYCDDRKLVPPED
jgi:hypothetical protein